MANGAVSVDVVMLHRHTMALSNRPDRVQDTDRQTEQSESSITTMEEPDLRTVICGLSAVAVVYPCDLYRCLRSETRMLV